MKIKNIILVTIILLLTGCNGYVSRDYYKSFINNELSVSLRSNYRETYGKRWKEYEERGIAVTPEELFEREDYISISDYYKQQTSTWSLDDKERKSKEYCVHSISYFFPINFWNLRFTNEQYVRKAIKDLNKNEEIKKRNMEYIQIDGDGLGTPIYSYFCIKITGKTIE